MTTESFIEVYKNATLARKLDLLVETFNIWRSDAAEYEIAKINGSKGADWLKSECGHMKNRAAWLYAELRNALTPRVLSLDEADEADVCWLEVEGSDRIPPCRASVTPSGDVVTLRRFTGLPAIMPMEMYGKDFRLWSARPTAEQRKAVPW